MPRNHPLCLDSPLRAGEKTPWDLPDDHDDRLMEARHECRLRTYPKILLVAANSFACGDKPTGSFSLPGKEGAEAILNSHFWGATLRIARQFVEEIAGLRIGLRREAAQEKGPVLAFIALQEDGPTGLQVEPDPWLDEPWTEEELSAIRHAALPSGSIV